MRGHLMTMPAFNPSDEIKVLCAARLPHGRSVEARYADGTDVRVMRYDVDSDGYVMDNGGAVIGNPGSGFKTASYVYSEEGLKAFNLEEPCWRPPLDLRCATPVWRWISGHADECTVIKDENGNFKVVTSECNEFAGPGGTFVIVLNPKGDIVRYETTPKDEKTTVIPFDRSPLSPDAFPFTVSFPPPPRPKLIGVQVFDSPRATGTAKELLELAQLRQSQRLALRLEFEARSDPNAPILLNGQLVSPQSVGSQGVNPFVWVGALLVLVAGAAWVWKAVRK